MSTIGRTHSGDEHTNHPQIVVHVKDASKPIGPDNPAHCFGPFRSIGEAEDFEGLAPDTCDKFALDLVGPW